MVLIIGMAVGIDYSLFYLRREREERTAGHDTREALRIAAATSGRAIVVSGLTVMIALAGLFLTGYDVFTGVALGTIAVVGVAVLGSLTVLPALLSWLGPWADRGRIPFLGRRRTAARPSRVVGRPGAPGGPPPGGLGRRGRDRAARAGRARGRHAARQPGRRPARQLPGAADDRPDLPGVPAVTVSGPGGGDRHRPHRPGGCGTRSARCRPGPSAGGPIHEPITATAGGAAAAAWSSTSRWRATAATPPPTTALLTLRDQVLPATLGRVGGISYAVTGDTAQSYDDTAALHSATPVVVAFVVVLAFVLLLVAFRSVAIPLVSIALNLLSVGAAYGLITLIFQDGRLQGLLGYTSFGGIIPWIPLFMFVLLFGLSMDYHVFILSRIRELRSRGRSTREAHRGRHLEQRRGGDQRGRDHGGGVLHPGHAAHRRHQDARRRPGRGGAHRRHRGARDPAARGHGRAGGAVLVPAALAGGWLPGRRQAIRPGDPQSPRAPAAG